MRPGMSTRTGINAALAHGGAISGTVSDAGGTHLGLAHVNVQVSSPSTGTHALVSTAADGSYLVPGFPAGTAYVVCFQASGATGGSSDAAGYVDQCWNNQPAAGTATAVSVTAGHTTPGINAALAGAGAVTNVTATPDTTSVDLSWTNPTGGSLTGVVIRRAPGDIAPATATDGSPVAVPEVAKPWDHLHRHRPDLWCAILLRAVRPLRSVGLCRRGDGKHHHIDQGDDDLDRLHPFLRGHHCRWRQVLGLQRGRSAGQRKHDRLQRPGPGLGARFGGGRHLCRLFVLVRGDHRWHRQVLGRQRVRPAGQRKHRRRVLVPGGRRGAWCGSLTSSRP